jgi:hypothetical protein
MQQLTIFSCYSRSRTTIEYALRERNKENVLPLLPHVFLAFAYNLKHQKQRIRNNETSCLQANINLNMLV